MHSIQSLLLLPLRADLRYELLELSAYLAPSEPRIWSFEFELTDDHQPMYNYDRVVLLNCLEKFPFLLLSLFTFPLTTSR